MYAQEFFSNSERALLHGLHQQALAYFVDNQLEHGLILDRQHNHGRRSYNGLCSTASTGMGLIALGLAATREHALISRSEAKARTRTALLTALGLRHVHGMMPHFLDAKSLQPIGEDAISTIDSSWLFAGALWAAEFFDDDKLRKLATQLYDRVDWKYWSKPVSGNSGNGDSMLIRHGTNSKGQFLPGVWDRFNSETAFMYLMAVGAGAEKALPPSCWNALQPFYGTVADLKFISADLGLFVFQYSTLLFDAAQVPASNGVNLGSECETAVLANYAACHRLARSFRTYRKLWCMSAGDGPAPKKGQKDVYRSYSPVEDVDGTAHLMASLASVDVWPGLVIQNLRSAQSSKKLRKARGRYGYSNINIDRDWFSRDVVGIDVGAAVMSLENALYGNRVRSTFHRLALVKTALERLANL